MLPIVGLVVVLGGLAVCKNRREKEPDEKKKKQKKPANVPDLVGFAGTELAGTRQAAMILQNEWGFSIWRARAKLESIAEAIDAPVVEGIRARTMLVEYEHSAALDEHLVTLGRYLCSQFGSSFLVDDLVEKSGLVVVQDVKRPEEAVAIQNKGGVVVFIARQGVFPSNAFLREEILKVNPDVVILANEDDFCHKVKLACSMKKQHAFSETEYL